MIEFLDTLANFVALSLLLALIIVVFAIAT